MTPLEGFTKLGFQQAQTFKDHPEAYLELLVTAGSQRSVMYSVYSTMRSSGMIKSIEDLPEEYRRDIWEEAKKIAAGRLDQQKIILLSKCLYCLNTILAMMENKTS